MFQEILKNYIDAFFNLSLKQPLSPQVAFGPGVSAQQ